MSVAYENDISSGDVEAEAAYPKGETEETKVNDAKNF